MNTENVLVRGLDSNGNQFFYTGRAGEGWVSPDQSDAFKYILPRAA